MILTSKYVVCFPVKQKYMKSRSKERLFILCVMIILFPEYTAKVRHTDHNQQRSAIRLHQIVLAEY